MANHGFYPDNGDNAHSGLSQDFYTQNMPSCSGINYQFPVQYVQPDSGLKSNYEAFVFQPETQVTPQDMNLSSTQLMQYDLRNQPNLHDYQSKSQGLSASADNTFEDYQNTVQPDACYMQTFNQHWVPTLSPNQGQCPSSPNNLPTSPYPHASHFINSPHFPISPSCTTSTVNASSQIMTNGIQHMFPIPPEESNGLTATTSNDIYRIPGETIVNENVEDYNQHYIPPSNPNQGTGQFNHTTATFHNYPTHPGNNIVLPQAHFSAGTQTMTGTQIMYHIYPAQKSSQTVKKYTLSNNHTERKNDVVPENKEDSEERKELEAFAQEAKRRRILLGLTQENVGVGIGALYGRTFSQTTICRYEACELSPSNMRKLQPIITKWFYDMQSSAECREIVRKAENQRNSAKRKSIDAGLSAEFKNLVLQPKPER